MSAKTADTHLVPARLLLALVLLVCALAPAAADAQTTWPVDATGITPNSTLTINESIALASPGDTIAVAPGLYVETVDFAGKDLIVQSTAGPATTTIVGTSYAVRFHTAESPAAQLDGFQLQTASTRGISIAGGASPTITNCTLLGVRATPSTSRTPAGSSSRTPPWTAARTAPGSTSPGRPPPSWGSR